MQIILQVGLGEGRGVGGNIKRRYCNQTAFSPI